MGTEITIFRKTSGILSKRISLQAGKVASDGSECRMGSGEGQRQHLNGITSLAKLIGKMKPEEALALGRLRSDLPERVRIATKANLGNGTSPDTIARTGDYLHFAPGQPAYMLLDHDRKGMPSDVAAKLKEARGFWRAVVQAVPALANAAYVRRLSTSAGLYHRKTGADLPGSKGQHIYLPVIDGADIERALKCLHDRLWLAGFGFHVVGAAGQLLDRSIIDASVYGPERLVFEGAPIVMPPLAQDHGKRQPKVYDGVEVNTRTAIADLSPDEEQRLAALRGECKARLSGAAAEARKLWAFAFARRRGLSEEEAGRIAAQALNYVLEGEFELKFDDPKLGTRTVADVLRKSQRYVGETLADPLEGVSYGRGKAKVLQQKDRCLRIHSFAHGGINYKLAGQGVGLEAFRAYKPLHNYIYTPTGEAWPGASVNNTIPRVKLCDDSGAPIFDSNGKQLTISATQWLDKHQSVEQMTWVPGREMLIEDWHISEGGWVRRNGVTCLNLYRSPDIKPGDPNKAGRWLRHIRRIYPDDADHIIKWLAHRVQRPEEKINHALLLGGGQGIGKDTLLEPVKQAVGPWNWREASPTRIMGRFTGFLKSVVLRVSEVRDLGESDRFKFYDHMKAYTAAPPDVLCVDEKNLREHYVANVCGVIYTTNHKTDGIHLQADDRRHFVAWSESVKEDFDDGYWKTIWRWYEAGGYRHVAAFLQTLDISDFDPKAPPPKTPAFWAIVDVGRAPEEAELADLIDKLGQPDALTLNRLCGAALGETLQWLTDRKTRRNIPYRLEACGYTQVRNPDDKRDGLWRMDGQRMVIYARAELSQAERMRVAKSLQRR